MNDLIGRQAAIDETWKEPSYTDPYNVLTEVRERIQSLPSAQPQRKGRWESGTDSDREWCICSECFHQQYDKTNYCPNCGAEMRGES